MHNIQQIYLLNNVYRRNKHFPSHIDIKDLPEIGKKS